MTATRGKPTSDTSISQAGNLQDKQEMLHVTVMSFGYKRGAPPEANVVFDVRFLKNPYWVEELRPLTGLDDAVQAYVLSQQAAREFIESIVALLCNVLPEISRLKAKNFTIAFGCTGGQHRSATLAEALAARLAEAFPHFAVKAVHRELSEAHDCQAKDAHSEEAGA